MSCKEIMLDILKHQTEAVMYHDQMTDYYKFLHLDKLAKKHEKQTYKELEELKNLKCAYINYFCELPYYKIDIEIIYPAEWKNKTSMEVNGDTLKMLAKNSLAKYLIKEENTLEKYKNYAQELKKDFNFIMLKEVCELIEGVEEEIKCLKNMIIEAQSYNYNVEYFK